MTGLIKNFEVRQILPFMLFMFVFSTAAAGQEPAGEKPLGRIAVIGPTHMTSLPAKEIREPAKKGKKGKDRSWIKDRVGPNFDKVAKLIETIKPDALVINGSLTWTGSESDYKELLPYLAKIKVPYYLNSGDRDLQNDPALETVRKVFGDKYMGGKSLKLKGLNFIFIEPAAKENYSKCVSAVKSLLDNTAEDETVILVGGSDLGRYGSAEVKKQYNEILADKRVTVRVPTSNSNRVSGEISKLSWSPPATGWSGGAMGVSLINIYKEKLVMENIFDLTQASMGLTVNRKKTEGKGKKGLLPQHQEMLDKNPELTIIQLADPQIGFPKVKSNEAQFQRAVNEINQLKPAHLLITGDLVHMNVEEEWDAYVRVMNSIKVPFYNLPGNHDVLNIYDGFIEAMYRDSAKKRPEAAKKSKELGEKIKAEGGGDGPLRIFTKYTGEKRSRFTIEDKGSVFICIPTFTQKFEDDDLNWLEQELKRTESAKHAFVVTHYPILPRFGNNVLPDKGGDKFLALMKKYKVAAVLTGHRHRFAYYKQDVTMHIICNRPHAQYLIYHIFADRIVLGAKPVGRKICEYLEFLEPRAAK
ncbi:MAG: metallophosphoesterase [Planctomycetota bacterium]